MTIQTDYLKLNQPHIQSKSRNDYNEPSFKTQEIRALDNSNTPSVGENFSKNVYEYNTDNIITKYISYTGESKNTLEDNYVLESKAGTLTEFLNKSYTLNECNFPIDSTYTESDGILTSLSVVDGVETETKYDRAIFRKKESKTTTRRQDKSAEIKSYIHDKNKNIIFNKKIVDGIAGDENSYEYGDNDNLLKNILKYNNASTVDAEHTYNDKNDVISVFVY